MVTCERIIKDFDPFIRRYGSLLARSGYDLDDARQDLSIAIIETFNKYASVLDESTLRRYCASALRYKRFRLGYCHKRTIERRNKFYILYVPIIVLWEPDFVDDFLIKSAVRVFYTKMSSEDRKICKMLCTGYKQKEVLEELNITVNRVGKMYRNIRALAFDKKTGRLLQSSLGF